MPTFFLARFLCTTLPNNIHQIYRSRMYKWRRGIFFFFANLFHLIHTYTNFVDIVYFYVVEEQNLKLTCVLERREEYLSVDL
jgi:hypothetical protein